MESLVQNKESIVYHDDPPLKVRLRPVFEMSDDQLYEFAVINPELRIERNAQGELIFMAPTGGKTGRRNTKIIFELELWSRSDGTGEVFDSSTGFRLPNGAMRSPDASWIKKSRLATLTEEEREKFIPLCPDFLIELRSPSDSLKVLKDKMQEYLDNGLRSGFLLDPEQRRVYIYRPNMPIEEIDDPDTVSGEPVLSGFILNLREIW
jgi:Uma2 family endonuclease